MMRRRVLLGAWPLLLSANREASAQQRRVVRVGYLYAGGPPRTRLTPLVHVFVERLGELGWAEGANLQLEFRYGYATAAGLAQAAGELVALKPDVLVAAGTAQVRALANATRTIPIVMAAAGDPVGTALVATLARPGGNVTGLSALLQEILPKLLSLLRELLPSARRVDLLCSALNPGNEFFARVWADAVRAMGIQGQTVIVPGADEIEAIIAAIRADAIVVLPDPMFAPVSTRLFAAATAKRLPAATTAGRPYVEAGSLMSYSVDQDDLHRQAAVYVDRILRGANPAETPVEQPSRYELVVNLTTARALRIELPRTFLLRADEVIE